MSKEKQIEEMAKVLCEDCAINVAPCNLNKSGIMCDAVREQAEALYNAGYRKQSEWISVEDRLPYAGEDVLVFCDGLIRIDFIGSSGVWYEHAHKQVTHWMPLPEAPKGGAE